MEAPEVHTPHAHPSGKGWLDMALGGSAFIISLVSLWLGIQHGRAMEKLVAANSWPNIEFDTVVDRSSATGAELQLRLDNNGIGPARVETLELWFRGSNSKWRGSAILVCHPRDSVGRWSGLDEGCHEHVP
jgi:hypothetical protein